MSKVQEAIKKLTSRGYFVRSATSADKIDYLKTMPWWTSPLRKKLRNKIKTQTCYVVFNGSYGDIYNERELIRLADKHKVGNFYVKKGTNSKDRTKLRDNIKTENYDNIPTNQRCAEEDPWSFD